VSTGEVSLGASWNGTVVLDIGNDVGAMVLRTSSEWLGREIDLLPEDPSLPRTHSAVRERRSPEGSTFAAVYPQLQAGRYTLEVSHQQLTIEGGRVTEVELAEHHAANDHHHSHH
jgi:NAD-dependent oxidoreductase involved in siderophore biosynthesis